MRTRLLNTVFVVVLLLVVTSCASIEGGSVANEATADIYAKSGSTKGVVVLAINWSRHWKCGAYENAEIMSMGFDRLPIKNPTSDTPSEVFLDGPPRLTKKPIFSDYALLLEPGEYALSSFDIKVARSASDVGHFVAKRSDLIQNGEPKAGSFQVQAGEIVYIGNFFVDCYQNPTLWRYYTEGRDAFRAHMAEVRQKYPFINPDKVKYRLFRTKTMGSDYELPQ